MTEIKGKDDELLTPDVEKFFEDMSANSNKVPSKVAVNNKDVAKSTEEKLADFVKEQEYKRSLETPQEFSIKDALTKFLQDNSINEQDALDLLYETREPPSQEQLRADWVQVVKDHGFALEEVEGMIDSYLETGVIHRDYSFRNGKIKFTFNSRDVAEDNVFHDAAAALVADMSGMLQEDTLVRMRHQYNLASSLVVLETSLIEHIKDDALPFDKHLEFVRTLPSPLFAILIEKLSEFDQLSYLATRGIAIENF